MKKGIFENNSAGLNLSLLITMILIGLFIYFVMFFIVSIPKIFFGDTTESVVETSFYFSQVFSFFSSLFIFLFPAIVTAYLCSKQPRDFLFIHKITDVRIIILTIIIVFSVMPVIELTAHFNSKMHFPEFMAPIESFMRNAEDQAKNFILGMMSEKGAMRLIVNLIVIAVMAGIAEEFLFRGTLLSIIRRKIKNPHVAIWIVAAIFSAVHIQFYGFVPRLLLGALMGYLLYWSGSIWTPIIAHFINNAFGVISMYSVDSAELYELIEPEIAPENMPTALLFAAGGLILFVLCVITMKRIRVR